VQRAAAEPDSLDQMANYEKLETQLEKELIEDYRQKRIERKKKMSEQIEEL